jgi:iron complex transport system substrate-binding protein
VVSAVDDTGVRVTLTTPATRLVSLVPSATDLLIALGAVDRIVGRTDYDTAPEVGNLPSVGGGLDPSLEVLVAQEPSLVIAWAEAGPSSLRSQLAPVGIAVFGLRTQDTSDTFRAIIRVGHLVGRDAAAFELASRLRGELAAIRASVADRPHPSVVYLVENDPPMIAGPGTFITQIIGVAGGRTAFPDVAALWPQVSLEEIVNRQPDVLILPELASLSSFVERMTDAAGWRELPAVRNRRVVLMPPELMSRPGPRIAEAARMLRDRLHPASTGGGM